MYEGLGRAGSAGKLLRMLHLSGSPVMGLVVSPLNSTLTTATHDGLLMRHGIDYDQDDLYDERATRYITGVGR